ncbi:DMT family transporter [Pseudochelatococcus sp. B33]
MASGQTAYSSSGSGRRIALAIGLMIGAVGLFSVLDSIAKFLVQSGYPVLQTVWARYFFHFLPMVAVLPLTGWRRQLHSARPWFQTARALLLLCGTVMFVAALRRLPLAEAYTISYVSPLIVTLLAAIFLRERVDLFHWVAIFVGVLGVVIVMQPGGAAFQWAMVLPLGMAFTWALFQVSTRVINQSDPPMVTLFYTGFAGTVASGLFLPFSWVTPTLAHAPLFMVLGVLGLGSHLLLVYAYRFAKASTLAPFSYTQLPIAIFTGYVVFSDLPELHVLGGASLIISSGIFIFLRETRGVKASGDRSQNAP